MGLPVPPSNNSHIFYSFSITYRDSSQMDRTQATEMTARISTMNETAGLKFIDSPPLLLINCEIEAPVMY